MWKGDCKGAWAWLPPGIAAQLDMGYLVPSFEESDDYPYGGGVKQGCPLSAAILDMAIDPVICLLDAMVSTIDGSQHRVCAPTILLPP